MTLFKSFENDTDLHERMNHHVNTDQRRFLFPRYERCT